MMMIMWSRPVVTTTGPSENMFYMHTWVPTWSWMFSYYSADMQNYNNFLKLPFSGHPKESAHFLCFSTSSSGAHSIMKYCDWRNGGAWRIYWLILINGLLGPTWKKLKALKKEEISNIVIITIIIIVISRKQWKEISTTTDIQVVAKCISEIAIFPAFSLPVTGSCQFPFHRRSTGKRVKHISRKIIDTQSYM